MMLSTLLEEPKNVPEAIILILGRGRSLNGSGIHKNMKGTYNMDVSYQAVHKACSKLIRDGKIIKDDLSYSLNNQWVEGLRKFVAGVKR